MNKTSKKSNREEIQMGRPALTPESRENQLVSLAINLAEKQLREGTASSQVITHYLKLGSTQAKLEQEKLKQENELLKAKTETLKSAKEIEKLYQEAIMAMKSYGGATDISIDEDDIDVEY